MAETIGSLADKLSIVTLKLYHMREQLDRPDISIQFAYDCESKVMVLRDQRDDLAVELKNLLTDVVSGKRVMKVYRQYKMYNDPSYRRNVP